MNEELINKCLLETSNQPGSFETLKRCYANRLNKLDDHIDSINKSIRSMEYRSKTLSDYLFLIYSKKYVIRRSSKVLSAVILERGLNKHE